MQNDGSNNFDDIFKNKLKDLSAESNPGDWIMMERLLESEGLTNDNEATDETRFDEVALDKLNSIPTAEFTPDWDRMSSLIDQMNEEPSMEPSEFDQAIYNKIKTTKIPIDMAAWHLMQPTLDNDRETVVQSLDDIAKEKLTSISEVESSWGTMNSKINRELFLPESILKYKVIEVALILLFAFSAAQLPISKISKSISTTEKQSTVKEQSPTLSNTEAVSSQNIDTDTEDLAPKGYTPDAAIPLLSEAKTEVESTLALAITEADSETMPNTQELANESIWDLPPTIVEQLDQYSSKPFFRFTSEAYVYLFQPTHILGYEVSLAFLDFYDQELINNVFGKSGIDYQRSNQHINVLERAGLPHLSQALIPSDLFDIATSNQSNNSSLILSLFTGSDYNEIVTPFDPVYAKEGTQQWNVGYAGGMALGMRFRNWELETGAIYASNQYSPQKLSTGYIASTLRDIELEIVKIPLNFRFNVNLWDKWKVYALSGATMNMVVQSEFVTEEVFYGKGSFTSPANPTASANLTAANSGLSQKDFGAGILQGGRFKDNSFFTANLGLGVERTLNNKWSVFAQPTYQRQIFSNGIGPNQDRYNAISLFLGTRVALSKKAKK